MAATKNASMAHYAPNLRVKNGFLETVPEVVCKRRSKSEPAVKLTGAGCAAKAKSEWSKGKAKSFPDVKPPVVQTLMVRNVPNRYTKKMLLQEIDEAGFGDTYDFLHLPLDPVSGINGGYAFINFVDPEVPGWFRQRFEQARLKLFASSKILSIDPASLQGFEANYKHYANARVAHSSNAEARPFFRFTGQIARSAVTSGYRRKAGIPSAIDLALKQN
eukprot:CAMPEP_0115105528 /NCGR_PEP_ID=MMETSP0227-20121206/36056_1 /TAXON_ID=89957 /ORGANISM="Polarella glacialis, Strain CCMP 1383" /LENGTH=217 /DNA_ID=CAMNT_0002502837 /DNA_START=146 /DNA_END=799 /DNA_ORIENTATION=+